MAFRFLRLLVKKPDYEQRGHSTGAMSAMARLLVEEKVRFMMNVSSGSRVVMRS
jgi:hypothetical protein